MKNYKKAISIIIVLFIINSPLLAQEAGINYIEIKNKDLYNTPKGEKIGTLFSGAKVEIIDKKEQWIKVKITGWIPKQSAAGHEDKQTNKNLVEFINARIESLPADFSRNSKPYRAHIRAYFQFRNNSKKTLTGLVYEATFLDSFGDILYKTTMKDQLKIRPKKTNKMSSFYYWEDNEFVSGEPYDKLQSAADAGTIKVKVKIKKAVFDDGTIVNF